MLRNSFFHISLFIFHSLSLYILHFSFFTPSHSFHSSLFIFHFSLPLTFHFSLFIIHFSFFTPSLRPLIILSKVLFSSFCENLFSNDRANGSADDETDHDAPNRAMAKFLFLLTKE